MPDYVAIQLQEGVDQGLSCQVTLQERLIVLVIGLGEEDLLSEPLVELLVSVNLRLQVRYLLSDC